MDVGRRRVDSDLSDRAGGLAANLEQPAAVATRTRIRPAGGRRAAPECRRRPSTLGGTLEVLIQVLSGLKPFHDRADFLRASLPANQGHVARPNNDQVFKAHPSHEASLGECEDVLAVVE